MVIRRGAEKPRSPLISQNTSSAGIDTLPCGWLSRYHRARPSTSLDKSASVYSIVVLHQLSLFISESIRWYITTGNRKIQVPKIYY
jgi:hypothetical protein